MGWVELKLLIPRHIPASFPKVYRILYLIDSSGHSRFVLRISICLSHPPAPSPAPCGARTSWIRRDPPRYPRSTLPHREEASETAETDYFAKLETAAPRT